MQSWLPLGSGDSLGYDEGYPLAADPDGHKASAPSLFNTAISLYSIPSNLSILADIPCAGKLKKEMYCERRLDFDEMCEVRKATSNAGRHWRVCRVVIRDLFAAYHYNGLSVKKQRCQLGPTDQNVGPRILLFRQSF